MLCFTLNQYNYIDSKLKDVTCALVQAFKVQPSQKNYKRMDAFS
jgi:hypothetical protein